MFQQLILVGHLGGDPEMRYTSTGVPVTNFSLAVSKRRTTADGETQDKTIWFRISTWRRQAEIAAQYLTKGAKVMVIGEIEQARPYTDRDGNLQSSIEVIANQFRFLDSRHSNGNGNGVVVGEEVEAIAEGAGGPDIPF
jgi:single-strand DNA-binding protein